MLGELQSKSMVPSILTALQVILGLMQSILFYNPSQLTATDANKVYYYTEMKTDEQNWDQVCNFCKTFSKHAQLLKFPDELYTGHITLLVFFFMKKDSKTTQSSNWWKQKVSISMRRSNNFRSSPILQLLFMFLVMA